MEINLKQYKEDLIDFIGKKINSRLLCDTGADLAVFTFTHPVSENIKDMLIIKYDNFDEAYDITLSYDINGCQIDWSSPIFTERSLKYILQELEDVMTYWEHQFN